MRHEAPVEPNERQLQREQKLHTEHAPRGRRLGSRAKDVGRSGSLRRGDWVRARTDARLAAKAEGSAPRHLFVTRAVSGGGEAVKGGFCSKRTSDIGGRREGRAACEAWKLKEYIYGESGYTNAFFSASWLRSSVVSVLIRLITDIQSLTGPDHITICSGCDHLACQETHMCDLVLAQTQGCMPS